MKQQKTPCPTIIIILLSAALMLLTGCGGIYDNYRALEELEIVGTLGLDRDLHGLTLSAAAGRDGAGQTPAVLRRSSPDLRQGMEALQDFAGDRQLFFAHTRYLLLGQDYAADGIGAVLDYVERDLHTRMGTALFVLRDERAETLLSSGGDVTALLASAVRNARQNGSSRVSDLRSTAVALSEYGAAAVCALRTETTAGSVFSEAPERTAYPDGYAILRSGALAGFLDGGTAEVFGFLAGYPGTVTRQFHDGDGAAVTLELQRSGEPEFRVSGTAETPVVEAFLTLNAALSAVDAPEPVTMPDVSALCRRAENEVSGDAEKVFSEMQALDADFLGLGGTVRRALGNAAQEGFPGNAEFRVRVEVIMDHSYDLTAPVTAGGGA